MSLQSKEVRVFQETQSTLCYLVMLLTFIRFLIFTFLCLNLTKVQPFHGTITVKVQHGSHFYPLTFVAAHNRAARWD